MRKPPNPTVRYEQVVASLRYGDYCPIIKGIWQKKLTNCLRVIRNAWHFYYALRFVFKVLCGSFSIALLTP
ncbi:DUF3265 domain-containing protein [Vibrio parahaemolyticus]